MKGKRVFFGRYRRRLPTIYLAGSQLTETQTITSDKECERGEGRVRLKFAEAVDNVEGEMGPLRPLVTKAILREDD